jgi:hypothetical protein
MRDFQGLRLAAVSLCLSAAVSTMGAATRTHAQQSNCTAPNMQDDAPQATLPNDAGRLNPLYRKQVESVGGEFIDIWDGLADEDGKFITTGSDINGQQAQLLGDQTIPDITRLGTDKNETLPTQPISLSDHPDLDGGKELLGVKVAPPFTKKSPRDLLVEKGEMAPAPAGRVDNYSLADAKAEP